MNADSGRVGKSIPLAVGLLVLAAVSAGAEIPDVLSGEIARFEKGMASPIADCRIEGAQGARLLRLARFEPGLLSLLKDKDPLVRREAVLALGECGTWRSIIHLIALLDDPDWAVRRHAYLVLCRLTGQPFPADEREKWQAWWNGSAIEEKQARLFDTLAADDEGTRDTAARALRCLATPALEDRLLAHLSEGKGGGQHQVLMEALDRIGGKKSMPFFLKRAAGGDAAAAWAVGRRGGKEAEEALLKGVRRGYRPDFLFNLDRVKSTKCARFIPVLCRRFTTLLLRGLRTDDVQYGPTPIQRAMGNLIRRSGKGPELVDLIVSEIEGKPKKDIPKKLMPHVEGLRGVLARNFTRSDGQANACLLAAMYHVCDDPKFAPRLIPLLKHKSYVTVAYVALTLGSLRAKEAVRPMVDVIRTPYPFSDSTALASGKHEKQSWTVRWKGYLAMALGRIGTDEAREALEVLAADSASPRDVRYGAVVGLGYIGSTKSLPILRKVRDRDIIWMVSDTARRTIRDIEIANRIKTVEGKSTQKY